MWRAICRTLDRAAMRSACGSVRPSPDGEHHGAEALELLRSPDMFAPEVGAAEVRFTSDTAFEFLSQAPSGCPDNDLVRGRIVRAGADWKHKPAVVLLHGWNAETQYQWMLPFWSELLARRGVNAVSFELPSHSARRSKQPGAIRNFISGNLLHFVRSTHQSLADARALARWLRANGAPSVGIWGTSLGAWLAGLAISHQPEFSCATLLTPVTRMDRALRDLPFCASIREHVEEFAGQFTSLNLSGHQPLCPPKNVLVVASRHDLFAPQETIAEIERAWQPEVWTYSHGHITILVSNRVMRRIAGWMAQTLGTSRPAAERSSVQAG